VVALLTRFSSKSRPPFGAGGEFGREIGEGGGAALSISHLFSSSPPFFAGGEFGRDIFGKEIGGLGGVALSLSPTISIPESKSSISEIPILPWRGMRSSNAPAGRFVLVSMASTSGNKLNLLRETTEDNLFEA
jgi:hypothetical protein